MARLLSAAAAAKRAGMGRDRFRAICKAGHGPACFNPPHVSPDGKVMHNGVPQYVDTVVDAWLESRDDRQRGAA